MGWLIGGGLDSLTWPRCVFVCSLKSGSIIIVVVFIIIKNNNNNNNKNNVINNKKAVGAPKTILSHINKGHLETHLQGWI